MALSLAVIQFAHRAAAQPPVPTPQAEAVPEIFVPDLHPLDPTVETVLELPRREPADYFSTVMTLIDLGRPDLAAPILDELVALNLTDGQLAALAERFGAGRMLRLTRVVELAPAGGEFAQRVMEAAAGQARGPERLAALITQMQDPSPSVRQSAFIDYLATGTDGVRYAIQALAAAQNESQRRALQAVLVAMHEASLAPVVASLATEDPRFEANLIRVLAEMPADGAKPFVVRAALTDRPTAEAGRFARAALPGPAGHPLNQAEGERILRDAVERYRDGVLPLPVDADNAIQLWHWDETTRELRASSFARDKALVLWAAPLAADLALLRSDNTDYRRQALLLGLEAGKIRAGQLAPVAELPLSPSVAAIVSTADQFTLSDVLADALANDLAGAAIAAAELLGERGNEAALASHHGRPSPLAEAAAGGHPRVRFAALRAIMQIDPRQTYAGASHVADALLYFAASRPGGLVLIAAPSLEEAANWAASFGQLGYETMVVDNGLDLVREARDEGPLDFVLVTMDIEAHLVREALFQLRSLPATSRTPVALWAGGRRLAAGQRLAAEHQGVIATNLTDDPSSASMLAQQLVELDGRMPPTTEERAAWALAATEWIADILTDGPGFYHLRRRGEQVRMTVFQPGLAEPSIRALAEMGTAASQRALIDLARANLAPPEIREMAVAAFDGSVEEHGILLTSDEIMAQYDVYNASAAEDEQTLRFLGAVLDTLESLRDRAGQ